ncbi:MAG: alpha/beta hydrolase [bacterium]|nr:alpha/beta hydrolase [bacterium]
MAAQTREQEQRKRRRKRLIQGILLGSAAIGVPALVNAMVARRAKRLPAVTWGSGDRYRWERGDVVFQRLGAGQALVLLHSFGPGHSGAEWRRAAEVLATEYRVYAPDLLGWGQSDRMRAGKTLAYNSDLYIRLIADFLRDVVAERAVVVAAGLPAAYAVQLATERPELVRALALVVPIGIERDRSGPDFKDAVVHRLLRLPILGTAALHIYTSRAGISHYLEREVYASAAVVDDALVAEHYRSSHQSGCQAALAAYLSGHLHHGVREVLSRLDLPLWIAWGRRASSPSVELADLWLREFPNAEIEVLEQCGVLPHAESPEEFCRKLELFLADLPE